MPRLWSETIDAHRREVRDAILDATAGLVAEHGLLGVTMSQVAAETGIGRATLYKYFASVEEILHAWHQRQVGGHLELLAGIADRDHTPFERLTAVLEAYARIQRHRTEHTDQPHGGELAAFLHRGAPLADAEQQLHALVQRLLSDAAEDGAIRADVSPRELTDYCLYALNAATSARSDTATQRLVTLTLDGLRR